MEHRSARTPRTVLTLPNTGRSSTWTGRTVSGQADYSVVAIPNRTVQLHFHCDDRIPPYTKSYDNSQFERLSTFWYEFPMRHFGIQIDELDNSDHIEQPLNPINIPDVAPLPARQGIANGGPLPQIRPRRLFHPPMQSIAHLRLSHSPTIGREFVYGCPHIGHELALSSLQAKSVLYTHHRSGTVDVLIIKIYIGPADDDFDSDHTRHYIRNRTFPNFNFHQPVLSREHFNMGNLSYISRNGINSHFKFMITNVISCDRIRCL